LVKLCQLAISIHIAKNRGNPQKAIEDNNRIHQITEVEFEDALDLIQPSHLLEYQNSQRRSEKKAIEKRPQDDDEMGGIELNWEQLGGYDNVKVKLSQIINWTFVDSFSKKSGENKPKKIIEKMGTKASKGILLFGPSGCGKSLIVDTLFSSRYFNMFSLKPSQIFGKYIGESERAIREVFKKARNSPPCILFVDDLETFASKRDQESESSGVEERILSTLLNELDGISSDNAIDNQKNILFIACSNRPDLLDLAILRPGRIDQLIHVGMPTAMDRKKIIGNTIDSLSIDASLKQIEDLTEQTELFTPADLHQVFREAGIEGMRENIDIEKIGIKHVLSALAKMKKQIYQKNVSNKLIQINADFEKSRN